MTRPFVSFSPSVSSNKPSGASKHEGLKWYTVWKLSIQLLMSEIWDPEAKNVFFQRNIKRKRHRERIRWRRERKDKGDGGEKEAITRFPCWDFPSLVYAVCNWKNSFTEIEQCLPNVLLADPPQSFVFIVDCLREPWEWADSGPWWVNIKPRAMSSMDSLCNYFTFQN